MLNIIKLAVGIEDVNHLSAVQQGRLIDEKAKRGKDSRLSHRTRNAPRQAEELLKGGSMYWVIKGRVAARQRIIGFETKADEEGRNFCLSNSILSSYRPRHVVTVPSKDGGI